jgi:SAM-dependent methyltransferase
MTEDRRIHWNRLFESKHEKDMSWFETLPAVSLEMLDAAGVTPETCIVDIGGGNSRLVDALIGRGFDCLAVVDVSAVAIQQAQARLGSAAAVPLWIIADVTESWTLKPMDVWHDRAVFHFLTLAEDQQRYLAHLRHTLKPAGTVIIATFALDGPERCSGLPVMRYSPQSLAATIGNEFRLMDAVPYLHHTPWGTTQSFQYSRFRRVH